MERKNLGRGRVGCRGGVCVWNTLNLLGLWGGSCFQNVVFPKTRVFFSSFSLSFIFLHYLT